MVGVHRVPVVLTLFCLVCHHAHPAQHFKCSRSSTASRRALLRATAPVAVAHPDPKLSPEDVVRTCMDALQRNDFPEINSGLATCYAFSNDMCRAAVGASVEDFCKYARNPVFQTMVNSDRWDAAPVSIVGSATPTRGAMATQMVHVTSKEGMRRSFLWTLQQERRPPNAGAWLVWQCLAKDMAICLTV
jgi:hypothetical protein